MHMKCPADGKALSANCPRTFSGLLLMPITMASSRASSGANALHHSSTNRQSISVSAILGPAERNCFGRKLVGCVRQCQESRQPSPGKARHEQSIGITFELLCILRNQLVHGESIILVNLDYLRQ